MRLHVGVAGQCPLGDEPQGYRHQQLRYPVRIGAGVERPGRLPPSHRFGEQFTLSSVGGAGWRLEAGLAGFDGAYLRFSGKCRVQYFRAGALVEAFADKAIWELMYFGHAR